MKLEHIKDEKCSVCGSEIVKEERRDLHTNGLYNEFRYFKCGRILHFSPNFKKVIIFLDCPSTIKEKRKRAKRKKAKTALINFTEKLDVDEKFKQKLFDNFQFLSC